MLEGHFCKHTFSPYLLTFPAHHTTSSLSHDALPFSLFFPFSFSSSPLSSSSIHARTTHERVRRCRFLEREIVSTTQRRKERKVGEEKKLWFMGSGHGLLWGKFLAFLKVFMLPIVYLARKSWVWFVVCLDSDSRFILVWISIFVRL